MLGERKAQANGASWELFLEESVEEDKADPAGEVPHREERQSMVMEPQLASQSSYGGEESRGGQFSMPCPQGYSGFGNLGEEGNNLLLSLFVPPRATLDPLVPLVLLEKKVPKVFEETTVPLAELVTLDFKVLQEVLGRKVHLEVMVPL